MNGLRIKQMDIGQKFFECVWKNATVRQAFQQVSPSEIVQLVGNPKGDITLEKALYWMILSKQLSVFGTWNSTFTYEVSDD